MFMPLLAMGLALLVVLLALKKASKKTTRRFLEAAKTLATGRLSPQSNEKVSRVLSKLRIFLAFCQIVSQLPLVLIDLRLPSTYLSVLRVLALTNFELSHLLPTRCFVESGGHYYLYDLLGTVLTPLVLLALLGASYAVRGRRRRRTDHLEAQIGFMVIYVTLPSVSTAAMQSLKCRSFDFGDTEQSFLATALAVSCESAFYRRKVVPVGLLATFLYPIGCPLLFMVLLYRHRHILNPPQQQQVPVNSVCSSDLEVLWTRRSFRRQVRESRTNQRRLVKERRRHIADQALVQAFSLLFEIYEPRAFFWEPIDVVRRLLLTAGVSLVPHAAVALAVGLVVSAFFGYLNSMFLPFLDPFDDIVALAVMHTVSLTLFVFLLLATDVISQHAAGVAASTVAAGALAVILYACISPFSGNNTTSKASVISSRHTVWGTLTTHKVNDDNAEEATMASASQQGALADDETAASDDGRFSDAPASEEDEVQRADSDASLEEETTPQARHSNVWDTPTDEPIPSPPGNINGEIVAPANPDTVSLALSDGPSEEPSGVAVD